MTRIAQIAGDGIGPEVMAVARRVLDAAGVTDLQWTELDWSCERYAREGSMMPADGMDLLAEHEAVLLGAVGWPGVPDHISLWGLLIPIRRAFDQYVNLRPMRTFDGVPTPVRADLAEGVDIVVVRENTEGEYSTLGGRHGSGAAETALQTAIFTRAGIERIAHVAARHAAERGGTLTVATKSNGIIHSMPFWDEVVREVAQEYPIEVHFELIDALAAHLVMRPADYDVVLGSNLFGDILSDLVGGVCGSIGIAPSANIDPTRTHPSMFEPVHGSAPDIAGQGLANPVGMVWSAAMMLKHLGKEKETNRIMAAITTTLADPATRTPDVGGLADTETVADALVDHLRSTAPHVESAVA
ncbi:isocitrate/isopropylmalate dehydrogenase family protein [Ruania alba]|uniref:Tartrate dehydrogenase/decarboxylase / D-malate dehydrogenase n=1 Tax=Ruania alba TaxID=648782 RepID=A0A1H5HPL9_9MICO|nr:isocitrate/isopropylmalate family dehydrogenase [Ruania alba]SEE29912.1 tartrate dehydrogenase/decarboxylase / D-malate dehydrogenase [Ruania alba]